MRLLPCLAIAVGFLAPWSEPARGQTTYRWANSNVAGTPASSLDWFTGGPNTQGTWLGGTPVSSSGSTVQFFEGTATALTNTATPSTQTINLNNGGSAFTLGTLTLSGLASATTNANLTLTLSGDSLNFSGPTGRINLDALNATRTITYTVNQGIQLGTAGSGSALTLTGNGTGTFTLGGIISEVQAGGGSLVKNGASTASLTAANTYTGVTTLQNGVLNLSGNGTMTTTSGITLAGGGITLTNTSAAESTLNRIGDATPITSSAGGTITYANTAGANLNYAETVGSVALQASQLNVVLSTNQNNATNNSQTLTLAGLTRSGASNTSTVAFSAASTGPQASTGDNMIVVSGAGTTVTGQIIGPWATTGTGAAVQTDYAVYSSNYVFPANIPVTAQSTWSTSPASSSNYTMSALTSATLTASRNINSLRSTNNPVTVTANSPTITLTGHSLVAGDVVTFSAATVPTGLTAGTAYYVVNPATNTFQVSATLGGTAITPTSAGTTVVASSGIRLSSGNDLGTVGILNGSATTLNIVPTSGAGNLTLPSATSGNLILTAGSGAIAVSAPLTDNGGGVLTLVKAGSGVVLLNASSTYSGGTVLNAGRLNVASDAALGAAGGSITLNGGTLGANNTTGTSNSGGVNLSTSRNVVVGPAGGAIAMNGNNSFTTTGNLSGSGTLTFFAVSGAGPRTLNFNSTGNTFTGGIVIPSSDPTITFNSLPDSPNAIVFNGAGGGTFVWGTGAIAPLVLNGRAFVISQTASGQTVNLNNNNTTAANTVTVNTDLLVNGTGTATLSLGGSNTGANLFAGRIVDGVGGAVGVTKTGAGNWSLSGTNAYSGTTVITGSSTTGDNRLVFQGIQALSPNTRIELRDNSSSQGTIRVLDDNGGASNGTVNRATVPVTFRSNQSTAAGVTNIFVGNNTTANGGNGSGTATGNTIALGGYISSPQNFGSTGDNVNITGANDYRLQLASLTFPDLSTKAAASTFTITLNPTTAPVTVAGNATAFASTNANSAPILALGGTAAGNRIDGNVLDPTNVGTSNALRITKNNTNDWSLNGSGNTFSGTILFSTTTASAGRLSYASAGGTNPITFNQTTASGTTLSYTGASPLTMSGLISATALTTGGIAIEANGTSPTATITYSNASSLSTASTSTGTRSITLGGSNTGDNTFAGGINNNTGAGGLTQLSKTGAGKWVLTGTSNFSGGLFVNQGTISVAFIPNGGVNGPLGATTRINLGRDNNDGTLAYSGPGDTTNRDVRIGGPSTFPGVGGSAILNDGTGPLTFTAAAFNISQTAIVDTRTLTLGGSYTGGVNDIQGVIQNNTASTGVVNLAKTGNGRWRLSAANTYGGTTTVSGGTLEIASTGSINNSSGITVAAGGLLAYNSASPLTAPTSLVGTGTGPTQRAVLGGTGTISLALSLDNTGDVLSPGNSPGIMPFTTSQTWSSFGYDWELNDWAASVAGTNIDQIQITGGLSLTGATAGSYVVDVLSLTAGNVAGNVTNFADATNSWTILTTTGGITGFDPTRWTVDSSGFTSTPTATGTWSVGLSNDSQNLVLSYNAVPEPSTLALAAAGLAALGWRLRRRA